LNKNPWKAASAASVLADQKRIGTADIIDI
jgi:hypothetical protein